MGMDIQQDADLRLTAALEGAGVLDPREEYRRLLRELRSRDEAKYEEAVQEYRANVLEAITARDADPLRVWLEFGCGLAEKLHPGRTVVVDRAGRARPFTPPPSPGALILRIPDDRRTRALIVAMPGAPTPAQRAAADLLAAGKTRLPDA
jgi:hypothetical protein